MKQPKLHRLTVKNNAFGTVNNSAVYMTEDLYQEFSQRKNRAGIPYIDLFKRGMAVRGLKHLLEHTKEKSPNAHLVLTLGPTRKDETWYFVNYSDYANKSQNRFLTLYREIGLDVSFSYLHSNFPKDFMATKNAVPSSQLANIDRNFPEVIEKLAQKHRHKKALIKKTTQVVENLRNEEATLARNVDELKQLLAQSSISYYQEKLTELRQRFNKNYPETQGKYSWQSWIYENNWIFGVQYGEPIEKEQVGFQNIPDFLFPTLDGFLDILEIKKPNREVLLADSSHPDSYTWASETNRAIGQVVNYIHQIELHQLELQKKINKKYSPKLGRSLHMIRPRAFILIGTSSDWDDDKKEAFRKLNYALHGIEVITYTDLLQRGENLIALYTKKGQ
ncbi:MAG: DUF4263 domain-containing protein [Dehalococcoidia bacterium]|nr:DUF4263 domain-containing protein [Dehalococcoidia bacterium]